MKSKKSLYLVVALELCLAAAVTVQATDFRRDCFPIYSAGGTERARQDTLIAQRGSVGFSGRVSDYNIIRAINPDFKWFLYISVEDNYVKNNATNEHDYVVARAIEDGEQSHACTGACADQPTEGIRQPPTGHHRRFEHLVGQRPGGQQRDDVGEQPDHPSCGHDTPLHVRRDLRLPERMAEAPPDVEGQGHDES